MKHPKTIEYAGGLERLARDIGDLRYDALEGFLKLLADKVYLDAGADMSGGRKQLAVELYEAGHHIHRAWEISKPHMPEDNR